MKKALEILNLKLVEQVLNPQNKEKLYEAIVELETLQNRSCNNCKYYHDEVCCNDNSLLCAEFVNEKFCCNKWESK